MCSRTPLHLKILPVVRQNDLRQNGFRDPYLCDAWHQKRKQDLLKTLFKKEKMLQVLIFPTVFSIILKIIPPI